MVIIDIASVEHKVFDGILKDLAKLGDEKVHEDHMSVDEPNMDSRYNFCSVEFTREVRSDKNSVV